MRFSIFFGPTSIIVFLPLCHPSHTLSTPFGLCDADTPTHTRTRTHTHTSGRVDATLSAEHWGVLLLTAGRIKAAVHPLLTDGCGAAGLAFVLGSIMAHCNYSVSRGGSIYLFHPLPHLTSTGQQGWTHCQRSFFVCVDFRCVCLRLTGIATRRRFFFFFVSFVSRSTHQTYKYTCRRELMIHQTCLQYTGLFTHCTTVWFPMKHANSKCKQIQL